MNAEVFMHFKDKGITLVIPNIRTISDITETSEWNNCNVYTTKSSFKVDGVEFEFKGETTEAWWNKAVPRSYWNNATKQASVMRNRIVKAVNRYWNVPASLEMK